MRIERSEIDWKTLGASAGLDAATCVACGGASLAVGFVFQPALVGVCSAPLIPLGALPMQYLLVGMRVPSEVKINLATGEVETTAGLAGDNAGCRDEEGPDGCARPPRPSSVALSY